jgi:predicted alpha/beta-fold hydrolase
MSSHQSTDLCNSSLGASVRKARKSLSQSPTRERKGMFSGRSTSLKALVPCGEVDHERINLPPFPSLHTMMSLFAPTTPSLHHAARTISLRTHDNTTVPLSEFVAPLIPPYYGNPLLFNGHLQTAWTVAKFGDPFVIHYARRHFVNPRDGGHFAVDFVTGTHDDTSDDPAPAQVLEEYPEEMAAMIEDQLPPRTRHMTPEEAAGLGSDDSRPMLILLHGLSGGSHEVYPRAMLHALLTGPGGEDWEACVVNSRGCAMSKISTKQLFNARWTSDIREAVDYLHKVFPNRPLFAVGFSLGANILTNYLGEQGENCVLKAAAVVSNPWDLELSRKALVRTWIGKEVYSKVMSTNLRRLFETHIEQLQQDDRIDVEAVRRGVYIHEFDRDVTAKVFGYPTVGAYYRDASSVNNILKVRVPLLVLHAKDDPISVEEALPYDEIEANPYAFMAVTENGGHVSWFEWGGGRWFAKPVSGPESSGAGRAARPRRKPTATGLGLFSSFSKDAH